MRSSQHDSLANDHHEESHGFINSIRDTGLTSEGIEHLLKKQNLLSDDFSAALHGSGFSKLAHCLGPICKLIEIEEMKEINDELVAEGHSAVASFLGAGASALAGSATMVGGAGLVAAGIVVGPEVPPIGAAAITSGVLLMNRSEEASRVAKHYVPIFVDTTLDKFTDLYSSVAKFVQMSYQRFTGSPGLASQQYPDVESAMCRLGYKEFVKDLYSNLDQNQQLLYGKVTRDLFIEQFKLSQDGKINVLPQVNFKDVKKDINAELVKSDIRTLQKKLSDEANALDNSKNSGRLNKLMKGNNNKLQSNLSACVKEANQTGDVKQRSVQVSQPPKTCVQSAYEFCEVYHATSQGVALVAHIAGNHRIAQKIAASAMGVSQVVMGVAQIAQKGWSFGPVGMALGGMNMLISCFGSDNSNEGMEALAEQLAIISKQIHALHEDMLFQFAKVFTSLGVINTNIIQGFKLLHEDQQNIFANVVKLQDSLSALQDSVNVLGHKVDKLSTDMHGYVLDDDRKQLQLLLNETREKLKRVFNRVKLHTQLIAGFKTFNEDLVAKKLNGGKVTSAEINKCLTTQLGSAEANTGLLLNYAKNVLGMDIELPIADPEQWRQCADLLIEMIEKTSAERNDWAVIGTQDYGDFKHWKQIGANWLKVIEQFKTKPDGESKLGLLFYRYRSQVKNFVAFVDQEINHAEKESSLVIKPKYQGDEELKKQREFKYEFKRNTYYYTATEDWSNCKGCHNSARFLYDRDHFGAEWVAHLVVRKNEIDQRLASYADELESHRANYEDSKNIVSYYNSRMNSVMLPRFSTAASAFMVSETQPDIMPLLPLPISGVSDNNVFLSTCEIPSVFIEAEMLGIGKIRHTYKLDNNEFVYQIVFDIPDEKLSFIVKKYTKACNIPTYLNTAEAAWHAYMGGTYPDSGSYHSLEARSATTSNGDYYVREHCALPKLVAHDGLRKTFHLCNEKPTQTSIASTELMISEKISRARAEWRKKLNGKIIQKIESLDSRCQLASSLMEIDATAKILIAYLSILFRDSYKKPLGIWTHDDVIDFVKHYQGQCTYLSHQLETNMEVLDNVEQETLKQINAQTESAYTPVKETLAKLTKFMEAYEQHVLDDAVLAAKEKASENKEATIYGAMQATLAIQTELLQNGHVEAALHISKLLTQSGLNVLSILQPDSPTPAQIGYARQRIFPAIQPVAEHEPAPASCNSHNPNSPVNKRK